MQLSRQIVDYEDDSGLSIVAIDDAACREMLKVLKRSIVVSRGDVSAGGSGGHRGFEIDVAFENSTAMTSWRLDCRTTSVSTEI